MNEVRRLWVSTKARLNREWVGIQGIVVPAEDYDELASECALLRHRVAELTGGLDNYRAMLLDSDEELAVLKAQQPVGTPSSAWSAAGQPDPHGDRYNCERAALAMGDLTDDELANGAFLNYDQPLNLAGIMAGTHRSPIVWMTAVKDRIRWLSRKLVEASAASTRSTREGQQ